MFLYSCFFHYVHETHFINPVHNISRAQKSIPELMNYVEFALKPTKHENWDMGLFFILVIVNVYENIP